MWRATWKGLIGHKLRFALSALAIALGVGLVAASFMFTDSLGRAFDNLFSAALTGFDAQVRPQVDEDLIFGIGEPLGEELVDQIAALDTVAGAQGSLFGFAQLVVDGKPVQNGGAPTFVISWPELLSTFVVKSGTRPATDSQLAIDVTTAQRLGIEPGAPVGLIGSGPPETFTLAGTAGLEGFDAFGGAVTVYLNLPTAQRVLGLEGKVMTIEVAATEGTDPADLLARLQAVLPDGVEAVTIQSAAEQQLDTFKDALGFLNTFLLVFAGVTVFVAAFLIQNTFRIVVAQRTRDLALFRAVGASRRQVMAMVVGEGLLVSLLASFAGLGLGYLLALGIRQLLSFGGSLPNAPLQLAPRTILVGVLTGVGLALVSAILPARAAGRVPPLEAIRQSAAPIGLRGTGKRIAIGGALTVIGGAFLAIGLLVEVESEHISEITLVGIGAGLTFIGVAVLTAVIARPMSSVLGRPLRVLGVPGRLAQDNAGRNPRRTAATASALMVGLALVSLVMILADSIKATTDRLLGDRFRADLVVNAAGLGGARLSPEIADRLATLPETEVVAAARGGQVLVGDRTRFVVGADAGLLARTIDFAVEDGEMALLTPGTIGLRRQLAEDLGFQVGDTLNITFARTGEKPFEVVVIWEAEAVGGGLLIDIEDFEANFVERFDDQVFILFAPGVDSESGRRAVESVTDEFPGAQVQDQTEFRDEAASQIDQLVRLVFGLLAVAVVISLLGITNTLSLSVLERTREVGLLRAVGLSRRQLRRSIVWESVLIAVFGGLIGTVLGVIFGWAVVSAIESDVLVLAIPWNQLLLAVLVAGLAGVGAAALPAWRASRQQILAAIAYE
jgi:putative ABC transport system permease protein